MKYNLSEIMTRAHKIRKARKVSMSAALVASWKIAKEGGTMMSNDIIANLEAAGAKRWTKNGMDRLYINAETLVETARAAGIIEDFCWNGIVSNRYWRELMSTKTYFNVADGSIHTTDRLCKAAAEAMLQQAV